MSDKKEKKPRNSERAKKLAESVKEQKKKQGEVEKAGKSAKGVCIAKGVRFPRDKFFKGESSFSEKDGVFTVFNGSERIDLKKQSFESLFDVKKGKSEKPE